MNRILSITPIKFAILVGIFYTIIKLIFSKSQINNSVIIIGIVVGLVLICYNQIEGFEGTGSNNTPPISDANRQALTTLSAAALTTGNAARQAGDIALAESYDPNATPVQKALAIVRMATQASNASRAAQAAQNAAREAIKQLFLAREDANNAQNAMNAQLLAEAQAEALLQAQAIAQVTGSGAQDAATAAFAAATDAARLVSQTTNQTTKTQ